MDRKIKPPDLFSQRDVPSVQVLSNSYSVTLGNTITLECVVTATPTHTSVQWQRIVNGQTTNINLGTGNNKYSGSTVNIPSLTISASENSDEGYYTCSATNVAGTGTSQQTYLDVVGSIPTVVVTLPNYNSNIGSTVTLGCIVTSNPAHTTVYWQRIDSNGGGFTINMNSGKYSGSTVSNPSLTISSSALSDEGNYRCYATNSIGTGQSQNTYLDVVGSIPLVNVPQSPYSVNYGGSITLTCTVTANPTHTTVYWQKIVNGVSTTVTLGNRYSGSTVNMPSLTITNADQSDEGFYVCYATNSVGTGISQQTYLDVAGNIPVVRVLSNTYSVNIANSITLECTITANPTHTSVTWLRVLNGVTSSINLGGNVQKYAESTVNTPSLTIYNAVQSDEGYYICQATNTVGTGQSSPTYLDVVGNQQSAQVEPVSGTSGVGPTTFQQDQSAKKKPMKSNNENEGDVSTIPQESDESDNPFPVKTINQGRTNYARLGLVVVDIFQNILREIMHINIAPEVLDRQIRNQKQNNPLVFNKMTHKELKSLDTLSNRTYDDIDFTTSYKLMRSLLLLDKPTQGWGKQPMDVDVTISDDVERLRNTRNKIVHRIKADIDLIEMDNYFSNIVHITQRIDTYLGKLPDQGFHREVLKFQTHCMDAEMAQKYYQLLKDIEDIKVKYVVENVQICYGKMFSNFIQDVQSKTKSSVIMISLVLEGINGDNKASILNELKTEINSGLVNIKFIQAVSGSLIIYIDILDSNLLSTEHELCHQIYIFLCRALQLTGFNMKTENEITVVLIKEEDDIEVEFSIEIDNWETYDEEISLRSNTLCLELDVNTEIFNTEQKVQSDFGLLLKSVLGSNRKSNIELVSARLEPGIVAQQSAQVDVSTIPQESDESAQQSAHVEPVSGTSGVRPTTFQQDQSAKMKPIKSNNENEGDVSKISQESVESAQQSAQVNVSTIPQESDESGKGKERENYFRICILVVDHIKHALVDMLKYYLLVCQKNMSFEEFINAHMADIKYLRKKNTLYEDEFKKLIVDDKAISGITVDDLEVTLVRRLVDDLCPDLFMDYGCKTLQDFLKKNQHDIYHLFQFNQRCCQCSQDYKFPVTEELLKEDQYKNMFKSSPCTNCAGKSGTVCSVSSCKGTKYISWDYGTRRKVFEHFSLIFKTMQKLTNLRDKVYGHIDAGAIPNGLYDGYTKDIEDNIMVLARICGNENHTRQALDDVQKRSCDETLCIQYKISLLEQVKRDQELKEVIGENSQKLQEIIQKLEELTEQVRNMNLNKDIYDGVVLHAEDDRGAAIEFITNMERENPDLKIGITIYENLMPGKLLFESAAEIFNICRYLFVFVTQNLVEADLEVFLAAIATFKILTSKEEKDRIIPVKTARTCDLPTLAPFHPLKYYHYLEAKNKQQGPDRHFIECFAKLINDGKKKYLVN